MLRDKRVVILLGVSLDDALDLLALSRRQRFMRIKTIDIGQQSLAAQNLMDARDASAEAIGGIEECRVGVGDSRRARKPARGDRRIRRFTQWCRAMNLL